jgi:tetratricopeptide (TPR) repeat protein
MIRQTHIRHILVLFFVFVVNQSSAQSNADSLLRVQASGKADLTTYTALIWVYVFNQPDSAIYFGNRALAESKRTGVDSLLGSIYNRMGVAYDIKSIPDSALHFYGLALADARKTGSLKTEGGALNNIGLIHWNNGELDKAIDYYIQAAEKFEKIGNLLGLGNTYNNIGLILYEDEQFEKSMRYYGQALKIRIKIDHKTGIAATYLNIAHLFYAGSNSNIDSAILYVHKAIPLYKEENDQYGLARAYRNLADSYKLARRFQEALAYFQKALFIQFKLGNAEGYASTYYNISDAHQALGDTKKQLAYLDTAEFYALQNTDLSLLWKVYRAKARAFGSGWSPCGSISILD